MIAEQPNDFDVVIVGGGPAGSTCAARLQQRGLSVAVIDKADFPRDKTCGGWITPPIVKLLKLSLEDYEQDNTLQPISGFRTGVIGRKSAVATDCGEIVSFGILRCEFDHYLLQRCGASLRLGTAIESLERTDGGWVINRTIRARMLVGAGGHFCPVAKRLNPAHEERGEIVQAQEVEFPLSPEQEYACSVLPHAPELYFCPDMKGYGWCFRKGKTLNIGLGREGEVRLRDHVLEFVDFLHAMERVRFPIPDRFKGHAYRLYGRVARRFVDDGVLLVGDALGLASPRSGEGIRPAIESAILAADAILKADGDFSAVRLGDYSTAIAERFGPLGASTNYRFLPAGIVNACARSLLKNRYFTKSILLDRWFLHRDQPELRVMAEDRPVGAASC